MNIDLEDINLYRDLIILYCPKKVGSTSLVSSIRLSASDKFSVFHTHENIIYRSYSELKDLTVIDLIKSAGEINKFTGKPRRVYIIDVFRLPIERKMSEYFEDLGILHFNNVGENLYSYPLHKIIKRFNDIFPYISSVDYYKDVYGILPDTKFDFEKKYMMYEENNVTWIKLRLSDSKDWANILSGILETEITIIKDYETDNKQIGKLYNAFKEIYFLPENYYNLIKSDKELYYYLDEKEREDYFSKWKNKLTEHYFGFSKSEFNFYMGITMENQFYDIKKSGHYLDDGCLCAICFEKRNSYLTNLKNNLYNQVFTNIIHNDTSVQPYTGILVNCFYDNGNIIRTFYNVL